MRQSPQRRTLSASFDRRGDSGPVPSARPRAGDDLPDLDRALVPMSPASSAPPVPRATRVPRADDSTVIVPATLKLPATLPPGTPIPPRRTRRWVRVLTIATAIAMLIVVLAAGAQHTLAPASAATTPPPTGRGPWTANAGAIKYVKAPPPSVPNHLVGPPPPVWQTTQPCQDSYQFIPNISQWSVPPGCYADIYIPNPANYVSRPGFGYCNWWAMVTHPNHPDITLSWNYPHGSAPAAGAVVWFDGGEQGAESNGHWAVAVAVAPDNYWVLISEMNFAWRGAGFGKVDYRYIHVSPGVQFFYVYD